MKMKARAGVFKKAFLFSVHRTSEVCQQTQWTSTLESLWVPGLRSSGAPTWKLRPPYEHHWHPESAGWLFTSGACLHSLLKGVLCFIKLRFACSKKKKKNAWLTSNLGTNCVYTLLHFVPQPPQIHVRVSTLQKGDGGSEGVRVLPKTSL